MQSMKNIKLLLFILFVFLTMNSCRSKHKDKNIVTDTTKKAEKSPTASVSSRTPLCDSLFQKWVIDTFKVLQKRQLPKTIQIELTSDTNMLQINTHYKGLLSKKPAQNSTDITNPMVIRLLTRINDYGELPDYPFELQFDYNQTYFCECNTCNFGPLCDYQNIQTIQKSIHRYYGIIRGSLRYVKEQDTVSKKTTAYSYVYDEKTKGLKRLISK